MRTPALARLAASVLFAGTLATSSLSAPNRPGAKNGPPVVTPTADAASQVEQSTISRVGLILVDEPSATIMLVGGRSVRVSPGSKYLSLFTRWAEWWHRYPLIAALGLVYILAVATAVPFWLRGRKIVRRVPKASAEADRPGVDSVEVQNSAAQQGTAAGLQSTVVSALIDSKLRGLSLSNEELLREILATVDVISDNVSALRKEFENKNALKGEQSASAAAPTPRNLAPEQPFVSSRQATDQGVSRVRELLQRHLNQESIDPVPVLMNPQPDDAPLGAFSSNRTVYLERAIGANGSLILFPDQSEDEGWIMPNPRLNFRAEVLRAVFPTITEDVFRSKQTEPIRARRVNDRWVVEARNVTSFL